MMLYEAFNYEMPKFGHMSFILGSDKQKLSKRHGATSCHDFNLKGYLPEALNNFIALLGWSSPTAKEILSMDEMIQEFNYDRLHSAPAVFDDVKLLWVNETHMRALPTEELWRRVEPFLKEEGLKLPSDPKWRENALNTFKTSMHTLKDAVELFRLVSEDALPMASEADEVLSWPTSKAVIENWILGIEQSPTDYMSEAEFNALQDSIKTSANVKGKNLFQPIRVAVIGKPHGTELKMLVPLLNKRTLVARAQAALQKLKA
jgi:nondiscriminating glutamyl-tRNA synthetase